MSRGPQNLTARFEAIHRYLVRERGAVDGTRIHISDWHRLLMAAMDVDTKRAIRLHVESMVILGYIYRDGDDVVLNVPPRATARMDAPKGGRPQASGSRVGPVRLRPPKTDRSAD